MESDSLDVRGEGGLIREGVRGLLKRSPLFPGVWKAVPPSLCARKSHAFSCQGAWEEEAVWGGKMPQHGLKGQWVLSSAHPSPQLCCLSPGGGQRQSLGGRVLTASGRLGGAVTRSLNAPVSLSWGRAVRGSDEGAGPETVRVSGDGCHPPQGCGPTPGTFVTVRLSGNLGARLESQASPRV